MSLHTSSFRPELANSVMPCPAEKQALAELQKHILDSLKETITLFFIGGERIFIDDSTIARWINMGLRKEYHIPEAEMIHDFTQIKLTGILYPNNSAEATIAIMLPEKDHQMKRSRDVHALEVRFPTVVPFKNKKENLSHDSE